MHDAIEFLKDRGFGVFSMREVLIFGSLENRLRETIGSLLKPMS